MVLVTKREELRALDPISAARKAMVANGGSKGVSKIEVFGMEGSGQKASIELWPEEL